MLKKIISIKNVGRIRNSAGTGNPQLAKHTLIAGANGFGKTTICAVLRSLQTGEAAHLVGRRTAGVSEPATVDLLLENKNARFDGQAWSVAESAIAIFDGVFVADNVHSGEVVDITHRRNLYRVIIGDVGAKLARQDDELAAASRNKTSEITAATRALQPHLDGLSVDDFIALPNVDGIDDVIEDQRRKLEDARQASSIRAREQLTAFTLPKLPEALSELLSSTIEDVATDAEHQLAEHLAAHAMVGKVDWIADRLEALGDTCPFCGQDVRGLSLIAAYRAVFGARYRALTAKIAAQRAQVQQSFADAALAQLEVIGERNKGHVEFWQRHCTFGGGSITLPTAVETAARELREATIELLDRKSGTPLENIALDSRFGEACAAYEAVEALVDGINACIAAANVVIAAKKAETETIDTALQQSMLARLHATKLRHSAEIARACDEVTQLTLAKSAIDTQKADARAKLDAHTQSVVKPYESRINAYLDVFNAGFRIAETKHSFPGGYASSSYQLLINGTHVDLGDSNTPTSKASFKNTLSSGDRTTLALAFFLAYLERDPAISEKLVVFDDPFNSQDAFRRRQTVHEIMQVAGKSAQVIVLSHDTTFLKQIWDKAPPSERIALQLNDHRSLGTKLEPIDLDKACQGRTAVDIDDLQTFLATGAGALLDIIRKMRVVLETYCRTAYPASFLAGDWLGDIVRKIREGGAAHPAAALYNELDQINSYTIQYHHGEDVGDATPDQIDPTELTGFVRRTLRIANALQA